MGTKKYSDKIRNRALKYIDKGWNLRQISKLVGVSVSSVHGWNQQRLQDAVDNSVIEFKEGTSKPKSDYELKDATKFWGCSNHLGIRNKQEIEFEDFRGLIRNKTYLIENYVINESSFDDIEKLKILNFKLEKILLGED